MAQLRRTRVVAGKFARQMFRAAERTCAGEIARAAVASSANTFSWQGRAISGPRASRRLGTNALGRRLSRARLQTQYLAHAMPRRKPRSLVCAAQFTVDVAGPVVGSG